MPRNREEAAIARARAARRKPSVAEEIVWSWLRGSNLGYKFRREHPIGSLRVDFYCAEARLVAELDGEQHDFLRDSARDQVLADLGLHVLRIPNRRLFGLDGEGCQDEIRRIVELCVERSPRRG